MSNPRREAPMTTTQMTKGEKTRAKIVEAAINLLAEHGYAQTSFQMVADSVGLTQSAVMHHFKSKDQLIEAVVETAVGRNRGIVESLGTVSDDAARRLVNFCRGNLLWTVKHRRDAQVLALLYYMATHDAAFASNLGRILGRGRQVILGHLLAGRREGLFRFSLRPEEAARLLQDCVIGAMLSSVADPRGVTPWDLEGRWEEAVALHAGWERAEKRGRRT